MAFTNPLGRTKLNFKIKIFLPISLKNPPHNINNLKTTLLLLDLNCQPKPQILIMMTFTNPPGRTKINFKIKIFLPISLKNPPHNINILKTTLLLLDLNRQPKPQIKNVFNVLVLDT